ncbi:RNA polymerase sigma factor [Pedobacter sp. V48]|uniref:RNA polymerase sigma factor n=1 Tax=Pedobacter sp. V48 TaxID=509635 RepID=UPI0003E47832|nr:sigma-70 family RNA polymerase sigma factor [Pedobacter sp. V48]ETZ19559.1 hypothetical protein N824_12520 [Pedobacter sp. V48]
MIAIQLPNYTELQVPVISLRIAEDELVRGIQRKCEIQFKLLYKMYAPALMGIISRIVRSDVAAEDVLQETFLKIWSSIDGYDSSRGRLFTWMAATARHKSIDYLRSRSQINESKNQHIEDFSPELDNNYQVALNPDTIGIKQLTNTLHPSEKELLDLIYFQGYTQSEAAARLEMPLGTVKTKLRRAINSLREYF